MSVLAVVTVTFEAADEAEAQARVSAWSLHEGSSVQLTINSVRSGVVDAAGALELVLPDLRPPPMAMPVAPPEELAPPVMEVPPPTP